MSYKDAGVDISAGEEVVDRIKNMVRSTFSPRVLTDLGKFGGFYAPDLSGYREPVLVSSIDGVGTKLKVAFLIGKHDSVGEDLVNHCVNDIFVGGAKPLFFLDYIGTGLLKPGIIEDLLSGMVRGCKNAGCALVGGEMAEMPGFYQKGEYDVAGCIVGIVEKDRIINGRSIQKGDVLIGLPSNGLHTNGYSLARKVLLEKAKLEVDTYMDALGRTVGEELLRVHRCYLPVVSPLLDAFEIKGMAHITGGGLIGNTKRILPDGLSL
ncbi:MAG: phosphoribosylformylglycinamidine cyclo-ligase, partial [bacterium]